MKIYNALTDLVPLCNLKNVKNTHRGVLLLVKFFKLYKWYQTAKSISNVHIEQDSENHL